MDELDLGATIRGFSPGQKLFGRYTLKKLLGRGGMGVVWQARDESLEQDVAIKLLPEMVAADPVSIRELKRETRRSQGLAHPHILKVHDFVEGGGLCGISMELVEGGTLSARRLEEAGETFTPAQLGPWVRQLCEALAYAHAKAKVVHRDLKPANLMLTPDGDLKVADFGIAASLSESVTRVSKQAGSSGTPLYMSPQQMMGDDPAVTDDLYALGATLYELLAGKPPFFAGNVMMQVQNKVPMPVNERRKANGHEGEPVPAEWEETIAACLAKAAADRPQSAGEVAERLGLGGGMATKSTRSAKNEVGAVAPNGPVVPKTLVPAQGSSLGSTRSTSKTPLYAGLAAGVILLAGLGWYFGLHVPGQKRLAEISRLESEKKTEEVNRLRTEQEKAAAKEQADSEQREYAVIVAKIDAFLDGSPVVLRASTDSAVKAYLAAAPARYRPDVETRWADRQTAWEIALQKEQARLAAERLAAARGSIVVRTNPSGAEVRVGAIALEKSPLTLKDQKLGKYPVRARLDGYEEWTGEVEVKENDFADLDVVLVRSTGSVVLTGTPGATVTADGRTLGTLPLTLDRIPTGPVRYSVSLKGYKFTEVSGDVLRNAELRLSATLEKIPSPEEGRAFTIPGLSLTILPISPGTFTMGSENGRNDEKPPTRVTLTKPFWLGQTEVTQAQWSAVMESSPSHFKGDNLPVERVSSIDVLNFCRKLTERERAAGRLPEGYAYTLPTEAQWEYACRAGTTGDYAGDLDSMGWYSSNSGTTTHAVGQKQANAWGLHDMHGNVWEWCADWYGNYPGGSVTDPTGAPWGVARVFRGGGWAESVGGCRSANRGGSGPAGYIHDLGFRLALAPVVAPGASGPSTMTPIPAAATPVSSNVSRRAAEIVAQTQANKLAREAATGVTTATIKVSVTGQVMTPSQFTLDRGSNILAAVTKAGGFSRLANPSKVTLTRVGPDGAVTTKVWDVKAMQEGRATDIPVLEEGDTIFVPERLI